MSKLAPIAIWADSFLHKIFAKRAFGFGIEDLMDGIVSKPLMNFLPF